MIVLSPLDVSDLYAVATEINLVLINAERCWESAVYCENMAKKKVK